MSIVAAAGMVGASVFCLLCSMQMRNTLATASAALMLLAMIDHGFVGLLWPVFWAVVLIGSAVALSVQLRLRGVASHTTVTTTEHPREHDGLLRGAAIASGVSYIVMAWLLLSAGRSDRASTEFTTHTHAGHGGDALLTIASFATAIAVVLVLVFIGAKALYARHRVAGIECFAMAAMIIAMIYPSH